MAEEGAGRRGERAEEGPAERGPGAAFHMFVLMEDLLDKLKLLSYEEEVLRRHNMRPLSRCCRPAAPPGPGRQGAGVTAGGEGRNLCKGIPAKGSRHLSEPREESGMASAWQPTWPKGKLSIAKASRLSWKLSKREAPRRAEMR